MVVSSVAVYTIHTYLTYILMQGRRYTMLQVIYYNFRRISVLCVKQKNEYVCERESCIASFVLMGWEKTNGYLVSILLLNFLSYCAILWSYCSNGYKTIGQDLRKLRSVLSTINTFYVCIESSIDRTSSFYSMWNKTLNQLNKTT